MMEFLFIGGIGTSEMLLIVFALLLLFGGKKLPELMRGLGRGIRDFKNETASLTDEVKKAEKELVDDLKSDL
ncbi:MAG: twin-arginine translocase TatA/TatE family subunit [Alistipes sp.]|nr:twin-arginine translocase TatA/TatE family subunit [Alistipes sp.]